MVVNHQTHPILTAIVTQQEKKEIPMHLTPSVLLHLILTKIEGDLLSYSLLMSFDFLQMILFYSCFFSPQYFL